MRYNLQFRQFSLARRRRHRYAVESILAERNRTVFGLTPRGRQFFREKILGFLRSAGATTVEVAKSPSHVVAGVVGAFGGPIVQIVALAMCIHAVGGSLPFVQVGAVYMGAKVLSGAAPVPGGLGAIEAALIAGLSGLGLPAGEAASAVLVYRLLTFWLGVPAGWVGLKIAETRGYV
jgi:glycosyltransferase 2 family protein